jgi:hypothetical protein
MDENNTEKDARDVQEQVEDGEEVLDQANPSSVLNKVLSTINNEFEHDSLDQEVRLLNAYSIGQSIDNRVPSYKYSIPGQARIPFLAHKVSTIWFIVRKWIWDADMPAALKVDEMGLGKTFTSVSAAMLCKLVTKDVVMGLPLCIVWGNTLEEWVNSGCNNYPGILSEE